MVHDNREFLTTRTFSICLPVILIASVIAICFTRQASASSGLIVATVPASNQHAVPSSVDITVDFGAVMVSQTITTESFLVRSNYGGRYGGTITFANGDQTAIFHPDINFLPGEKITVMLTTAVLAWSGNKLEHGYSWSFTVASGNTGTGWLGEGITYSANGDITAFTIGDFNGDRRLDIAATGSGTSFFFGNEYGMLDEYVWQEWGGQSLAIGPLNDDLSCDILLASDTDAKPYFNDGAGSFFTTESYAIGFDGLLGAVIADMDGDGDQDVSGMTRYRMEYMRNRGDGSFRDGYQYFGGSGYYGICDADIDGDGDIDVLSLHAGSPDSVEVIINPGNFELPFALAYSVGDLDPRSVAADDLDGDGDCDIVTVDYLNSVSVLLNNGDGTFGEPLIFETVLPHPLDLVLIDFDGDGDMDIVTNTVEVLRNDGSGNFQSWLQRDIENTSTTVAAADMDRDGNIDVIVEHPNGSILVIPGQTCRGDYDDDLHGDPAFGDNGCPPDNCPYDYNPDQRDDDGDGIGNACDDDADNDGIADSEDNCPDLYNPGQEDEDGDGIGDVCEFDHDDDGVPDSLDNCPDIYNPGQEDRDHDGLGNACDNYFGSNGAIIDITHVDDPTQPMDTIYIGGEYLFRISIANNVLLGGVSLPLRVTGHDGATWEFVEAEGFSNPPAGMSFITGIPGSRWMNGAAPDGSCWDLGGTLTMYNPDGDRPDQFIVGGAALNSGLDAGPLEPMIEVHFRPGGEWRDGVIGSICIDTMHYPPCGGPIFSPGGTPSFNLPRCWPVKVLCGDANGNGDIDIFDVVLMVNYIFKDGPPPDPWQLGDANNDGVLDIGDALYLLYAAFRCGPKPECPDVPPTEPLRAPHPPLPVNSTDDRLMEMLCDSIFFRE